MEIQRLKQQGTGSGAASLQRLRTSRLKGEVSPVQLHRKNDQLGEAIRREESKVEMRGFLGFPSSNLVDQVTVPD